MSGFAPTFETAELLYLAQALLREHDLDGVPVCELGYLLHSPLSPAELLEAAALEPGRGEEHKRWAFRQRRRDRLAKRGATAGQPLAAVYANAGRWLVRCPDPNCGAVQHASWTDRRLLCANCANRRARGAYLQLTWPDAETVAAVEALLAARPLDARNWEPADPLELVEVENTLHGLG